MPHYDKFAHRKKPLKKPLNIRIGQKVAIGMYCGNDTTKVKKGKVVWIHPINEFAVIEFRTASGQTYRSAFRNLNGELMKDNF